MFIKWIAWLKKNNEAIIFLFIGFMVSFSIGDVWLSAFFMFALLGYLLKPFFDKFMELLDKFVDNLSRK